MAQQAEFLEQLDRAVDGGQIDLGDGRTDLFRGGVLEAAHRIEHLLALRGHAQPALVQALSQIDIGRAGHGANGRRDVARVVAYPVARSGARAYGGLTRERRWSQVEYVLDT